MKTFAASLLIASVVVTVATAQTYNGWLDQWHRAKLGRSPIMEEARQIAVDITGCRNPSDARNLTGSSNTWFDGWQRAKFGRSSIMEDVRQSAENRCPDAPVAINAPGSGGAWREQWRRAKFGRGSIMEDVRRSAEGQRTVLNGQPADLASYPAPR